METPVLVNPTLVGIDNDTSSERVEVTVKNPYNPSYVFHESLPTSTTIDGVKNIIRERHVGSPNVEDQSLICYGKMANDGAVALKDLSRHGNSNVVLHLLLSGGRAQATALGMDTVPTLPTKVEPPPETPTDAKLSIAQLEYKKSLEAYENAYYTYYQQQMQIYTARMHMSTFPTIATPMTIHTQQTITTAPTSVCEPQAQTTSPTEPTSNDEDREEEAENPADQPAEQTEQPPPLRWRWSYIFDFSLLWKLVMLSLTILIPTASAYMGPTQMWFLGALVVLYYFTMTGLISYLLGIRRNPQLPARAVAREDVLERMPEDEIPEGQAAAQEQDRQEAAPPTTLELVKIFIVGLFTSLIPEAMP